MDRPAAECRKCFKCITLPGWGRVRCQAGYWTDETGAERTFTLRTIIYPKPEFITKHRSCEEFEQS